MTSTGVRGGSYEKPGGQGPRPHPVPHAAHQQQAQEAQLPRRQAHARSQVSGVELTIMGPRAQLRS